MFITQKNLRKDRVCENEKFVISHKRSIAIYPLEQCILEFDSYINSIALEEGDFEDLTYSKISCLSKDANMDVAVSTYTISRSLEDMKYATCMHTETLYNDSECTQAVGDPTQLHLNVSNGEFLHCNGEEDCFISVSTTFYKDAVCSDKSYWRTVHQKVSTTCDGKGKRLISIDMHYMYVNKSLL